MRLASLPARKAAWDMRERAGRVIFLLHHLADPSDLLRNAQMLEEEAFVFLMATLGFDDTIETMFAIWI
jgi:hypothetical protein